MLVGATAPVRDSNCTRNQSCKCHVIVDVAYRQIVSAHPDELTCILAVTTMLRAVATLVALVVDSEAMVHQLVKYHRRCVEWSTLE